MAPSILGQGAEGGRFPGRDKGSPWMTVSPARPRREESNKDDHFRSAFCPARRFTEKKEEKKQMAAILETA